MGFRIDGETDDVDRAVAENKPHAARMGAAEAPTVRFGQSGPVLPGRKVHVSHAVVVAVEARHHAFVVARIAAGEVKSGSMYFSPVMYVLLAPSSTLAIVTLLHR